MSASCDPFVFQTTHLCHSVFSCLSPCGLFHVRLVASEKLATRLPPLVDRTSGSFPRLPISVTLFRLRLTMPPGERAGSSLMKVRTSLHATASQLVRPGHFRCDGGVPTTGAAT